MFFLLALTPLWARGEVLSPYGVSAFVPSEVRWDAIADAGIGWGRCDFSWESIETSQDVFNWATTDALVAEAAERGVQVYAGLGYTPAWASSGGGHRTPPDDPNDWYDFVFQCVSRYKGTVKHWEMWNEPNLGGFWSGTRSQFINDILKVGADAVHAADPDAMVLAPEISSCTGFGCQASNWMRDCLQQAGDRIDIISHHQYDGGDVPSGRLAAIDAMHNYIVSLGYGDKPIWITECGFRSDGSGMNEQIQAQYLTEMLEGMAARPFAMNFFWYQIWEAAGGEKFGLLHPDETPKLSWFAFRDFTTAHPAPETVSVNLSTADLEAGVRRVTVADGDTLPDVRAGRSCRRNLDPSTDLYFYFDIDEAFASGGNRPAVAVRVDYYDGGAGTIALQYDGAAGPYTAGGVKALAGVNTWKQAAFAVNDGWFGGRQNGGADFRIHVSSAQPIDLDVVRVVAESPLLAQVTDPEPSDDAADVGVTAGLSWSASANAASYDVYFGTTQPPAFQGNQAGTTFDPGAMERATTYAWRVDAVNAFGTTMGAVWSFTTVLPPGDLDGDGDVDLSDFGIFQACLSGSGMLRPPGCEDADLDGDFDVDGDDFGDFQVCLGGADLPPGC